MNYKEEMEKISELIEQRKNISNQLSQQKEMVISTIDMALQTKMPTEIDIYNDVAINVCDTLIEIVIFSNNIPTKAINILEDILGEGQIEICDDEMYIYFKY